MHWTIGDEERRRPDETRLTEAEHSPRPKISGRLCLWLKATASDVRCEGVPNRPYRSERNDLIMTCNPFSHWANVRMLSLLGLLLALLGSSAPASAQIGSTGRPPTPQDYTGDGRADYVIWRPSTGEWWISDSATGAVRVQQWGEAWKGDIPVPADYDGDGKTDIAVWRTSTFEWWIIYSSTGRGAPVVSWGQIGDVPVPADYDRDGKADIAIYREVTGEWWLRLTSTGRQHVTRWAGAACDNLPVAGDFDGDGYGDVSFWSGDSGGWHAVSLGSGAITSNSIGRESDGDIPAPGDYDGDRRTDFAVYSRTQARWQIIGSAGSIREVLWGDARLNDVPVPADFDGDGRTDVAIWRPGTGEWHVLRSSDGARFVAPWGSPGDIPMPRLLGHAPCPLS